MSFQSYSYMHFTLDTGTLVEDSGFVQPGDNTFTEASGGSVADTFEVGETYTDTALSGDWVYQGYYDGAAVGRLFAFQSTNNSDGYILVSLHDAVSVASDPNPGDWPDSLSLAALETSDLAHCFAAGTGIAMPHGERAVEMLKIGDLVATTGGHTAVVKWVGRQSVHRLTAGRKMQLVRIFAGAFGDNQPHSDLTVTADHGMVIDGFVINASALINGTTIDWVPMAELEDTFTVYHIETENHDVILANGAPSETFIDYRDRAAFDNHQEYLDLYGAERIIPEMPSPRISTARLVPHTIRAKLGLDRQPASPSRRCA